MGSPRGGPVDPIGAVAPNGHSRLDQMILELGRVDTPDCPECREACHSGSLWQNCPVGSQVGGWFFTQDTAVRSGSPAVAEALGHPPLEALSERFHPERERWSFVDKRTKRHINMFSSGVRAPTRRSSRGHPCGRSTRRRRTGREPCRRGQSVEVASRTSARDVQDQQL